MTNHREPDTSQRVQLDAIVEQMFAIDAKDHDKAQDIIRRYNRDMAHERAHQYANIEHVIHAYRAELEEYHRRSIEGEAYQ